MSIENQNLEAAGVEMTPPMPPTPVNPPVPPSPEAAKEIGLAGLPDLAEMHGWDAETDREQLMETPPLPQPPVQVEEHVMPNVVPPNMEMQGVPQLPKVQEKKDVPPNNVLEAQAIPARPHLKPKSVTSTQPDQTSSYN